MKSPNKKKLKSGVQSTIGGKLGGSTYKTASPYSIKINNMTNTNGLSPLMQAAVGGEEEFHTSGMPEVLYTKEGEPIDTTTGEIDEGNFTEVQVEEETGLEYVEAMVDAENYRKEDRLYLQNPVQSEQPAPPMEEQMPGGVGGPMEMQSPNKIYKKPKGKRTEY